MTKSKKLTTYTVLFTYSPYEGEWAIARSKVKALNMNGALAEMEIFFNTGKIFEPKIIFICSI